LLLLPSLTQAVPAGTTQLSSSQAGKLSAWLTKGDTVSDLNQALHDSRPLFMWSAAACRVFPSGSPMANSMLREWLLDMTQAAAAYIKAAALIGKLESTGLEVSTLSSSSSSSSSSSVASVTAAAIDLLSLVAVDFASYEEALMYEVVADHVRPILQGRYQQLRKQGGGSLAPGPAAPPSLLTVCSGEKRGKLPKDVRAVFADVDVRKALGHTLLVFYGSQLQQHLSKHQQLLLQVEEQQQRVGSGCEADLQHATAAAVRGACGVSSSWEEAEGLLLLGADRLQGSAAAAAAGGGSLQLAAVVSGWHRQLQQYRQALGYTEQQLEAAAALLANAGQNSSSSSSSSSSELISVRDCLKYLAAAAVCLPCPPLPTRDSVAARTRRQEEFSSLQDVLPHAPALLLFSASAALQLLSSQQALPLLSHLVWWASYAQFETDALMPSNTSTSLPQPSASAQTLHANLQLQRCAWVKFGDDEPAQQSLLRLQYADVTASIAGLLAQQLLQLEGARMAPGHRHEPPAAIASCGAYGPALTQCSHLLHQFFVGPMQVLSAVSLELTPALFAQTAAAVQASEAIMRLLAQRAAAEPAAEEARNARQQGQELKFLEAVVFPVTALQLLCRAPQELCQSVAGQQLLQAAVSAILTAVKLQGSGRMGTELLTVDVAACMMVVCEALNAVICHLTAGCQLEVFELPQHKQQQTLLGKHTRGQSAAASSGPQPPQPVSLIVAAEALQVVLQLFARCLHLFGSHLQALYEADAAAAAAWLSEQHAELKIVKQALQEDSEQSQRISLLLGAPVSNLAGIMSGVAVFSKCVTNGAWLLGAGEEVMQSSGLSSTPHTVRDSEEAACSSSNSSSSNSSSSSRQALMLQVLSHLLSEVEEICNMLQIAGPTLDKILRRWQQQRQQWQQQQQQRPGPPGRTAQPWARAGFPQEPELSTSADFRIKKLAQALTSFADKVCYVLPGRFCCSHPGCSSLGSVSEGHALVRGKAAICGRCREAR